MNNKKKTISSQEENKRYYTWGLVTYAEEEQVKALCVEQGKNWAFIRHDKDVVDGKGKEPHWHIVITFEQMKSFSTVVRLAKTYFTDCNTMVERVNDIGGALLYLTHETEKAVKDCKYQYERRDVQYSSKAFYEKYVKGEEISENDQFVDDLLCPKKDFSVVKMARRYGRDFIKNCRSYIEFRAMALAEESGINAVDYYHGAFSPTERDTFRENGERVNDVMKGD